MKHRSILMLVIMVVELNLELEQIDIKTAFLYGDLDETRDDKGTRLHGYCLNTSILKRNLSLTRHVYAHG